MVKCIGFIGERIKSPAKSEIQWDVDWGTKAAERIQLLHPEKNWRQVADVLKNLKKRFEKHGSDNCSTFELICKLSTEDFQLAVEQEVLRETENHGPKK